MWSDQKHGITSCIAIIKIITRNSRVVVFVVAIWRVSKLLLFSNYLILHLTNCNLKCACSSSSPFCDTFEIRNFACQNDESSTKQIFYWSIASLFTVTLNEVWVTVKVLDGVYVEVNFWRNSWDFKGQLIHWKIQ